MNEFRAKLTKGFEALRRRGYFARHNWQCCQSCGCAALPEGTEFYVFYHRQDAARLRDSSHPGVMLAWGGDGEEIRKAFLEVGCAVTWDGAERTRIYVSELPAEQPVVEQPPIEIGDSLDSLYH